MLADLYALETRPLEQRYALAIQEIEYLREENRRIASRAAERWSSKIFEQRRGHQADLAVLRKEVERGERELLRYQQSGRRTLDRLLSMLEISAARLRSLGEVHLADKIGALVEDSYSRLQPVLDVPQVAALLREWSDAAPLADVAVVADLSSRTRLVLGDLPERYEIRRRTRTQVDREVNPSVSCACGCGAVFKMFDSHGRRRRYVKGHSGPRR